MTKRIVVIASLFFLLVSCKNGTSVSGLDNEPKAVLYAFFQKLAAKDYDGAEALATKDSKSVLAIFKLGLEMAGKMGPNDPNYKDPAEEFKNVEMGDVKINGDEALVSFKNKKTGSSSDFPLKKENGNWKVNLSINALQKMNARENNGDTQSIDTAAFHNGMKVVDSAMKHIDIEKLKDLEKQIEKLNK